MAMIMMAARRLRSPACAHTLHINRPLKGSSDLPK
jgi:hypothetical protein